MSWPLLVPLLIVRVLADLLRQRPPVPPASRSDDRVFDASLRHVLAMEGGWSNDPHDPGGPTHRGLIIADLATWRGIRVTADNRARLVAELRALGEAETREIYRALYWQTARCAELPPPLALFHFDAAVNHGVAGAARMLQTALGVDVDGKIGPMTRAAAHAADPLAVIERYGELRRRRYRSLHHFWRFGRGWIARVAATRVAARKLSLATGKESPVTTIDGTKTAPASKWWGESLTIWGALITAATTVLPLLGPILGLDLTPELVREAGDRAVAVVQALSALAGTLMTIWGRSRAAAPLGRRLFRVVV